MVKKQTLLDDPEDEVNRLTLEIQSNIKDSNKSIISLEVKELLIKQNYAHKIFRNKKSQVEDHNNKVIELLKSYLLTSTSNLQGALKVMIFI